MCQVKGKQQNNGHVTISSIKTFLTVANSFEVEKRNKKDQSNVSSSLISFIIT